MTKKSIKIIVASAIILGTALSLSGCNSSTAEDSQESKTNSILSEMNKEIGMPNITNFTEKKQLKEIYELRDQSNLICYAYTQNSYDGKFVYLGECQGYGIPYGTEFTNPSKQANDNYDSPAIPQADPNGLYQSQSTSATWLIMIDSKTGKQEVMYAEPNTVVYQTKLASNLCESWSLPSDY